MKSLAALILATLTGLAHANSSVSFWLSYDTTISGWDAVDNDNDPDNGPFYPESYRNGVGGYSVDFVTPDGVYVGGYRDEEHGIAMYNAGVPYLPADIGVSGEIARGEVMMEGGSIGSSTINGGAGQYLTLLPGVTMTFNGYLSQSWSIEAGSVGFNNIRITSWNGGNDYEVLFSSDETFAAGSSDGSYETFSFQFSNTSDVAVERVIFINAYSALQGGVAVPVPEPETYAMMLAGLGILGLAARRRQQHGASRS